MRAVCFGLLLAAIGVELVLQLVALALWAGRERQPRPAGPVVVCVGDSLTFGLGAEPAESYPSRLQELLRRSNGERHAVNAGIPGQNSVDVLLRLPELLATYEPEVVCLLVGWNDTWSRPKALAELPAGTARFPWRWRTGRLLDLALAQWRAGVAEQRAPEERRLAFLGSWHVRGRSLHFATDGTADLGGVEGRWEVDGEVLRITPANGATFVVRWREREGGIEFALLGWDRFHRAYRGPANDDAGPVEFEEAIELGDVDGAQRILAAARAGGANSAAIGVMQARLCLLLLRSGRRQESIELLHELERAWQQRQDPVAGAAVAQWRTQAGEAEAAATMAEAVVDLAPEQVACWRILVDRAAGDERAALATRVLTIAGTQQSAWRRAELFAEAAVSIAPRDPDAAIRHLLAARGAGIGPDETVAAMRRAVAAGADGERVLAAVQRAAAPAPERDALERDVRRAVVGDAEMFAVIEHHVRLAAAACRSSGARLVLLGYPFAMPAHEASMQRFAAAEQLAFVSTVGAFDGKLAESERSDWFSDEIHCTARGYELMATIVADRLTAQPR